MEMDTPEQPPKEPTKHTRVRLASPRKQLERTIQKMAKLSEIAMKPEKLVELMTTMAGVQVRLLDMDRDAKDAKHAKHEALIQENERLKSELAARPTDEDIQIKLMVAKLNGGNSGLLQQLQGEVETLKSQSTTLRAENTELAKTNNGLKAENSQLVEQVQSLQ
jgi:FtsZ-binding cell division protein ZapB